MPQMIGNDDVLRAAVASYRKADESVGFVPTMGALHAGHLSLVRAAKAQCGAVVVSIFVNPMQFGPQEDLARYPRQMEQDRALLQAEEVDILYVPETQAMYPEGFATTVSVAGLSDELCGAMRPRHFAGVATVVTKLLMQVMPDAVYFGEKDYQQLQIVRRLVRDLSIPVQVHGIPTARAADGLALSSRNAYLSDEERRIAPLLYKTLATTANKLASGMNLPDTLNWAQQQLLAQGFNKVDYFACRDARTLEPLNRLRPPARLLAAAWLGDTRLIDNVAVGV